jgi:hypothetical protein
MRRFLWVLVVLAGCKDDGAAASDPPARPRTLAGVYPEKWQCDSVVTLDTLAQLLGGTAKPVDTAVPVERGLPHQCIYEVQARDLERWMFDVDCRAGMKQRADALFAQYKELSRDAIEHYASHPPAGGTKGRDAGVELHPPEPAVEVAVGAKGLDHRGQGLIFIDDDAPCYVRVVGGDASRRLELAKHLATHLTFANAPMTPRASP